MFATKPSSREVARNLNEEYSSYPGINSAPKLRHSTTEDLATPTWITNESKIRQATSIGTFSPPGTTRSNKSNEGGFFSLFKGTIDPDLQSDLSTRHIQDEDGKDTGNRFEIWSRVLPTSGSRGQHHFVLSDNLKFILNCCMWYLSSSLTNNVGKSIMNAFQFPVTLTFVQFGLVAFWCYVIAVIKSSRIRSPTHDILKTITPLALFLIVGHVFSSIAISRVPVSLVHTIKALAPLFTVLFYRLVFQVSYTQRVYVSLIPLTVGVILACSFTFSNNIVGLSCALGSCFIFVTQNIFSKKLLFKESKLGDRNPNKLDKLNVLYYSSIISFILMVPLWMYYDGNGLFFDQQQPPINGAEYTMSTSKLIIYLFLNGTMNFSQNWFAFTTLSLTSPVTYSILSLLKRIFVIVMSIVWFGQHISLTQFVGIFLTFVGLWMYQKAKSDVDKGEIKIREKESIDMLPIQRELDGIDIKLK
ncbi:RNA binding protein, heterogenous nuclear RNP-K like protein [Mucor velutinosus]|uniref:NAD-dependent deacetylase hst3 n=1 Tax=Mucor velutinosus TaxID=708070 RepID=A0AAN7D760_9FUNG|nr:NAD-dependent deacetylase hst3 [Mucor velutinosus]KAK4520902.1 RNA binding protein, heterogenous nuclear RNP-K like protein [Mucor velutinosus]